MIEVWIVEDHERFRTTLLRTISRAEGFGCSLAVPDCESALESLRSRPGPEVLLLDINLPGMSGIDGIREFKAKTPTTHIINLTVFDDEPTILRAICAGASGYLLKTAAPEVIIQSIHEVVEGGAPMSPGIARSVLKLFSRFAPPQTDHGLTLREHQTLELLVKGHTKKEIASQMELSYHTVDKHVRGVYAKLQVRNMSSAVAKAMKLGFV
jgi:DNA-binding NarL/FixJ family response regulator